MIGLDGARLQQTSAIQTPIVPSPDQGLDLATPPADLPADQQDFWRLYAAHAIEQRTLIPATVIGFRELCEQFTLKQALTTRIGKYKLGAASKSADGPLRAYVKLAQRVDATLARFKLTSFGKPADAGQARKPSANPWAQVAAK